MLRLGKLSAKMQKAIQVRRELRKIGKRYKVRIATHKILQGGLAYGPADKPLVGDDCVAISNLSDGGLPTPNS